MSPHVLDGELMRIKLEKSDLAKQLRTHRKKVEKVIDSILKESGMSHKEFEEVKGIAKEMKESG